jgi:hypothetical protein
MQHDCSEERNNHAKHPHLPVAEPAAGAESEARSEMPRASIIVSLLVALSTSLVAVWIRALDVLRSSFIMVPLLGDVLRRVGFSCLGGNRGLADCWERERGEERRGTEGGGGAVSVEEEGDKGWYIEV